jgi:hypothetical protein
MCHVFTQSAVILPSNATFVEASTIHAQCPCDLHSNTTSGEVSTIHVKHLFEYHIGRLDNNSRKVTVRTVHQARYPLSMQSTRLNATSGEASTIHTKHMFERDIWRGVYYSRRAPVRTLPPAIRQLSTQSTRPNTISRESSRIHAKCPRDLCSNRALPVHHVSFKCNSSRAVMYPHKVPVTP